MPRRSARRRSGRRCAGSSRRRAPRRRAWPWSSATSAICWSGRTQLVNALRGHLAEFGFIVRQGVGHVSKLIPRPGRRSLDRAARPEARLGSGGDRRQPAGHPGKDPRARSREIVRQRPRPIQVAKRLMTIPGGRALRRYSPGGACAWKRTRSAEGVTSPPGRGLTPKQHSSGGKERLGRTSKMGERTLRRLLILGASSAAKNAGRAGSRARPVGLVGMLARKPRMLVVVALANKMARIAWALMAHGGIYRAPAAAV